MIRSRRVLPAAFVLPNTIEYAIITVLINLEMSVCDE